MRRLAVLSIIAVAVASVAVLTIRPGAADETLLPHDHALFDATGANPDIDVRCGSNQPFEVFGSFAAFGDVDAVLRVKFNDGDTIDYPIPAGTSFSFTQAAGETKAVDGKIVVRAASGEVVGWLSASRHGGTAKVLCRTTKG